MKPAARSIATVALAALSVLPATRAQARMADQERDIQPVSRPADQTPAQRTLERTLAKEHHAYPAAPTSSRPRLSRPTRA
jgi:hypothetical protein